MSEHIEVYDSLRRDRMIIVSQLNKLAGEPVKTFEVDRKIVLCYPDFPSCVMAAAADAIETLMEENDRLRQRVADLEKGENHHDESTGNH